MSEILNDLKKYADHRGFPEELPNFNTTASRAVREVVRLRAQLAKATAALEACRTAHCGYAITKDEQYPKVVESFWKELSRIDGVARAALLEIDK